MKDLTSFRGLILINVILAIGLLLFSLYQWNESKSLFIIENKLKMVHGSTISKDALTEQNMNLRTQLDGFGSGKNVILESHEWISALHKLGNQVGIENIRMIKPDKVTENKEIILEKFHVEIDGEYNRIMRFINRIETKLERTYIKSIRFNAGRKNPLRCDLKVVFIKPVFAS